MIEDILIFPFNGNGLEAAASLPPHQRLIGFIDDNVEKHGTVQLKDSSFPVYSRDALQEYPGARVLAVPGSPTSYLERDRVIDSLGIKPSRLTSVIDPTARISPYAQIGTNVLIMAGVVIAGNARVGNHVCILPNSVVHHDSFVGDYTLVGGNVLIAGHTKIGRQCYIGGGSNIINNIQIGDGSLVGMGSNVLSTVPPASRIAGNPARSIGKLGSSN